MLEKMDAFFEARLMGYDDHMLTEIEGAQEFYPATAEYLPRQAGASVLDLGCGTGLELEYYFRLNPSAKVTGIDLSQGMLEALEKKFSGRQITLIQGSYFDVPLGENCFDGAVSVESLHHFTREAKTELYRKLRNALKEGASFILTDYFACDQADEDHWYRELLRLKAEYGIPEDGFYHYDTPLTVENETKALLDAGFCRVEELGCWAATHILRATR